MKIAHKANIRKVIGLLICLVTLISASLPFQSKFKNLKVLDKNISEEALDKLMDEYKISLGVDCNYCHVKIKGTDDFASDYKSEKEIARKMILMTTDINKKYFDFNKKNNNIQAVTCYTCHKGEERPAKDSLTNQK